MLLDELIIDYLVTQGAITAKGTDGFMGPVRPETDDIPNLCVFALLYSEGNIIDSLRGASGNVSVRAPRCQVSVRADKNQFSTGQTLCQSVWDVLHLAPLSGTLSCRVISGPFLVSRDFQGGFVWTINIEAQIES